MLNRRIFWYLECIGNRVVGGHGGELQHLGSGVSPGREEIVIEAGEVDRPLHPRPYDLCADPTPAHEKSAFDEVPDGPTHRRPRHAQLVSELDLIVEPAP